MDLGQTGLSGGATVTIDRTSLEWLPSGMPRVSRWPFALLVALSVALSACGGCSDEPLPGDPLAEIKLTELAWELSQLELETNTSRWNRP